MKVWQKTTIVTVIIAILIVSATLALRTIQADSQFKATQAGISMLLQLQASAVYEGYFCWTKLQDHVKSGELDEAESLLRDMYEVYPFIEEAVILPGIPPQTNYEIVGSNTSLAIIFCIEDDMGYNPVVGWVGRVTINLQELLDAYPSENRLAIVSSGGKDFGYSIHVKLKNPLLKWWDYPIIFLMTATIGPIVALWLARKEAVFFQTKGLESIIFLFEQNEFMSADHSRGVAAISYFLGERMGFKGRQLRNLYTAALLHDIGKISIPTNILLKTGPLTEVERKIIQKHSIVSAKILDNFRELSHLRKIVLYHHERMDGSGYPEGLKGDAIPIKSRIIAVADVFEALIGERPYHQRIKPLKALDQMRSMSLDQSIVDVLNEHFAELRTFKPPKWVLSFHNDNFSSELK